MVTNVLKPKPAAMPSALQLDGHMALCKVVTHLSDISNANPRYLAQELPNMLASW